jgi:hypothetical protein
MHIKELFSKEVRRHLYGVFNLLPDSLAVRFQYFATLGRWPNLQNPQRFTEKLQWYKLHYRNPLMTRCADKFEVKNVMREYGLEKHVAKLYQVVNDVHEIDFDLLPESFVIKSTNSSGTNIFVHDKSKIDFNQIEKDVKKWKQAKTVCVGREWAYKNIPQKLIVEEIIPCDKKNKNGLIDYKFLCFNGEPKVVWVDINRFTNHVRRFFDLDWNVIDVESNHPSADFPIPKPDHFDEMVNLSKKLSADFPFVRVDLYNTCGQIYLGELTFYPWSGTVQFTPDSFDYTLGEMFVLP